jgi:hypothetical protein
MYLAVKTFENITDNELTKVLNHIGAENIISISNWSEGFIFKNSYSRIVYQYEN